MKFEREPMPVQPRSRHRAGIAGGALALAVLSGTAAACGGESSLTCSSPIATSRHYRGDATSGVNSDEGSWRNGVIISPQPPADPKIQKELTGYIVGFQDPNDPYPVWELSEYVPPDKARQMLMKLGPDSVTFGVCYYLDFGAGSTNVPPDVNFGEPNPVVDIEPGQVVEPTY